MIYWAAVSTLLLVPLTAGAQSLGTFRWQLLPYCNVLTLHIAQQGAVYTLDGTDDRCGAAQAASARGMAFLNPNGTIGFGVTMIQPGGTPVHLEATISLPTLNGTWRDSSERGVRRQRRGREHHHRRPSARAEGGIFGPCRNGCFSDRQSGHGPPSNGCGAVAGRVILGASGYFFMPSAATIDSGFCSITTFLNLLPTPLAGAVKEMAAASFEVVSFGGTH